MAKISPIRQLRALNSSANTSLHQSEAIQRASWHIASVLASYGGSHPKKRDDESFAAYFRRREGQKQQSTSSEAPSNSSLISQYELSYWHSPHMPILTRQQLELSLLEIRRREREKQKKNDAQHMQSSPATLKKKKEAAILVPVCSVQGIPSILFTRRSAQLSSHASQISFPGGYYDEELDTSTDDQYGNSSRLVNTALREMHEELQYDLDSLELSQHASDIMDMESKGSATNNLQSNNIQASAVQHPPLITILGQTQPVPSMTGSKVTPIIGTINYDLPHDTSNNFTTMFPGNPDEVDWIFTVPIQDLIDSETSEPLERWSTNFGDHTANSKSKKKIVASGPVFPVPEGPNKKEGDKIWGLTAIILRPLLKHVFGPVFGSRRDDATTRF